MIPKGSVGPCLTAKGSESEAPKQPFHRCDLRSNLSESLCNLGEASFWRVPMAVQTAAQQSENVDEQPSHAIQAEQQKPHQEAASVETV